MKTSIKTATQEINMNHAFELRKLIGQEYYGSPTVCNNGSEMHRQAYWITAADFNEYADRSDLTVEVYDKDLEEIVEVFKVSHGYNHIF